MKRMRIGSHQVLLSAILRRMHSGRFGVMESDRVSDRDRSIYIYMKEKS